MFEMTCSRMRRWLLLAVSIIKIIKVIKIIEVIKIIKVLTYIGLGTLAQVPRLKRQLEILIFRQLGLDALA